MTSMHQNLISLIRAYPCLYDKNSAGFRDEKKKQNIWKDIGETVGYSGEECETKFISLRRKYMRERKVYELKLKRGIVSEPTWEWYTALSFLRNHIKVRRSVTKKKNSQTKDIVIDSPPPVVLSLEASKLQKRKKPIEENCFEKEIVKHLKNIENEDEVFGQLISIELKKMDNETKKRVKHAIYTITMFPEKIENFTI